MKINTEIDGKSITIILTKKQLKAIQEQIKPEKWQDKLVSRKTHFSLTLSGDDGCLGTCNNTISTTKPELSFATPAQAQVLANKCNLMIEMHNYAHAVNDGWVPDWTIDQEKYGITYSYEKFETASWSRYNCFIFGISVKSEELAEQMLKEFGIRLIKFHNQQY